MSCVRDVHASHGTVSISSSGSSQAVSTTLCVPGALLRGFPFAGCPLTEWGGPALPLSLGVSVCLCLCVSVSLCLSLSLSLSPSVGPSVRLSVCLSVPVCPYVCMPVCTYICTYSCMYMCIQIYRYTSCIHTWLDRLTNLFL